MPLIAFFLALITAIPVCLLIILQAFLTGFEAAEAAKLADLMWRSIAAEWLQCASTAYSAVLPVAA